MPTVVYPTSRSFAGSMVRFALYPPGCAGLHIISDTPWPGRRPVSNEARLGPQKLVELRQALASLTSGVSGSKAVGVDELQATLLATLPRIIAINWEPEGGKNQLDAAVATVLARLKTQAGAPALKKTVLKVAPALRLAMAAKPKAASASNAVPPSPPDAALPAPAVVRV